MSGLVFECADCHEQFDEDDLQQVQPDGRYACPLGCGEDTDKPPLFVVIPSPRNAPVLRPGRRR